MLNILLILVTLIVFYLDKSGNDINELHSLSIHSILVTLEVSHFDKSGKDFKEMHQENI